MPDRPTLPDLEPAPQAVPCEHDSVTCQRVECVEVTVSVMVLTPDDDPDLFGLLSTLLGDAVGDCRDCWGTGQVQVDGELERTPCVTCDGTGAAS